MSESHLTVLNFYTLKGPAAQFQAAIDLLADRVKREGHPGIRSYRFFVNDEEKTARAVIDYENADAWIGHHDIAMGWPEMLGLHASATLSEVTFLGPLSPEIKNWIDQSTLTAKVNSGNVYAAGFRR